MDSIEFPESELILNKDGSVYHLNLKPENLADIVLAVGDPGRVYQISKHFDNIEFEMVKREFITHTGTYKGKRVTAISTGMSTANIEIFINELDALVNIDLKHRVRKELQKSLKIIRIGTSGSFQADVKVGAHLVSEYAVGFDSMMFFYQLQQTDFEKDISATLQQEIGLPFSPYCVEGSSSLLRHIGEGLMVGNTLTAPGFYAPQGRKLRFELAFPDMIKQLSYFSHNGFRLTNFEMETAAYYALCRILGHETVSANAIIANRISNKFANAPGKIVDELILTVLERVAKMP